MKFFTRIVITSWLIIGCGNAADSQEPMSGRFFWLSQISMTNSVRNGQIIATYHHEKIGTPERQKRLADFYLSEKKKVFEDDSKTKNQKEALFKQIDALLGQINTGNFPTLNEDYTIRQITTFDFTTKMFKQEREPSVIQQNEPKKVGAVPLTFVSQIRTIFFATDSTLIQYTPGMGSISISDNIGVLGRIPWLGIIETLLDELGGYSVIKKSANLDGLKVALFEFRSPDGKQTVNLYTDSKVASEVKGIDFSKSGSILRSIRAKNYQVFCATAFPTFIEDITYSKNDPKAISTRETWTIQSAQFNFPISREAFEVLVPSGCQITDQRTQETHVLSTTNLLSDLPVRTP